jgi:uncharacterized FAD-dependent dehydrogenase
MLRITELRLPLNHPEEALRPAIVARLGIRDEELRGFTVFRRGYDARKKTAIVLIYTLDCELADEAAVARRLADDPHIRPTPDTRYQFVGHAPADFYATERPRPVVIGFGPCGIFSALILAQMGLRPIVLERGKAVRERTRTPGACGARSSSTPSRTCSSAKAAPAPSPTASSGARSATRATSPARC